MLSIAAVKQHVNCFDYLASKGYTLAGTPTEKYIPNGCPFCGTANKGNSDRFRVWQDRFWCRQCGVMGDVIDLAERLEKVGFVDAIKTLDTQPQSAPAPTAETFWDSTSANRIADNCHKQLMESEHIGQRYLLGRGIEPHAWMQYRLGFTWGETPQKQPAITIPWCKGGTIVGIKHRYITQGLKNDSAPGSRYSGSLYGGHALNIDKDTLHTRRLILCEGELNCISLWQAAGEWVDVLSVGSEGHKLTKAQADYLKQYGTRFVWMDKAEHAARLAGEIGAKYATSTQFGGGTKQDANDILKTGELAKKIVQVFFAIVTAEQRPYLRWALDEAMHHTNSDPVAAAYCNQVILWE